jgi:hypothetical protein
MIDSSKNVLLSALCLLLPTASATFSAEPLSWFKGNTHTHSLWSDGDDFPEMIVDWYAARDYHFLGLSDHNILARGDKWMGAEAIEKRRKGLGKKVVDKYVARFGEDWVQRRVTAGEEEIRLRTLEEFRGQFEKPGSFLLIESEEVSAAMGKVPIHINAINVSEVLPPLKDLADVREVMRANLKAIAQHAVDTGKPVIAHVNHPNFKWALTAEDLAYVIEDRFFEVFNGHPAVFNDGDEARAESSMERVWDVANTIRVAELEAPLLYGVATDDSHHYHGGDVSPGRGWVMVRAEKLEADRLMEAMERGDFYASTGVVLKDVKWDADDRELKLEIAGEPGVTYTTQFIGTRRGYDRAVQKVPTPEGDAVPYRLKYSEQVGEVLAVDESLSPTYQLVGDELFVRAGVTSSRRPANPLDAEQREKAWTQPVR